MLTQLIMILVTGASGFVGRHLVSQLTPKNNVRCLVRSTSSVAGLEGCELVKGDITDIDSLINATKDVSAVIHLVAALGASSYVENYKIHVTGAKNLIEACKTNNVKRIVVASSVATLAEKKSDYGVTKAMADELFLKSGLDVTILKPDFIYGRDGKGFLTLVSVIKNGRFVPIIGNGRYRRQPVHVDDVAAALFKSLGEKAIGKTYIVASRDPIEFNHMVDMIAREFSIKKRKIHVPVWLALIIARLMSVKKNPGLTRTVVFGIAQDRYADISPLVNELGVKPRNFEDGLKEACKTL